MIGYVSSSEKYKENIEDLEEDDTPWIYDLTPKKFDYKDKSKGTGQIGLIAEDIELINENVVSYKRNVNYKCENITYYEEDDEGNKIEKTREECKVASIETTGEPETVNYGSPYMITAIITELQNLKEENAMIKEELCRKDSTYGWCVTE